MMESVIERLNGVVQNTPMLPGNNQGVQDVTAKKSFGDILKSALNEVNRLQIESDQKTELLAQGKIDDLHDVMITAQKASITVEAAVQIQQKAIDAYNEMMRMQV